MIPAGTEAIPATSDVISPGMEIIPTTLDVISTSYDIIPTKIKVSCARINHNLEEVNIK